MTDALVHPRLVLVHGTRMSRAQWDAYPALLPGLEVVAVDLPGHGARVREGFTMEAAVAVIEAAVSDREPGQMVVLAGHSLGGYAATVYAAQHRSALDMLVLIGATADPASRLTLIYRAFAAVMPLVGPERVARAANAVMRSLGARGEVAATLPDGAAYDALPAAWGAVMQQCGPELLRDVHCPVVMVNGQWDQMRVHVRRFAAVARQPMVLTIPGATHLMPATHVESVAAVLRQACALATLRGRSAPPPTMEG